MPELGINQKLTVARIMEHGVYLKDDAQSFDVLLPKKEMGENLKVGDEAEVFLYRDSKDRLIATTRVPKIRLHEVARLNVVSISKIGAFVDWGLEKDLLLPYREQTKKVAAGEDVLVALYVDKSDRLCLTMNVYEYLRTDSPYKKDDRVSGTVYQISERFGAFVAVDDTYSALIPAHDITSEVKIGRCVNARVTDVREDGKLTLCCKEKAYLQMDEDAKKLMEIIEEFDGVLPFGEGAAPEVIKRETGMSKNAFKRALGRLYKERRIEINDKSIRKL